MRYRVVVEGRVFEIEVGSGGQVWVDRCPLNVDLGRIDGLPLYSLLVDHRSYEAHVEVNDDGECRVEVAGRSYRAHLQGKQHPSTRTVHCHHAEAQVEVSAPLPGLLVEVRVTEGQQVGEGEVVAVLESMKMHLELCAPRPGVVRVLPAVAGQEVGKGDLLAIIEDPPSDESALS